MPDFLKKETVNKINKMEAQVRTGGKILYPCEYPNCTWSTYHAEEMIKHRNGRHQETKEFKKLTQKLNQEQREEARRERGKI